MHIHDDYVPVTSASIPQSIHARAMITFLLLASLRQSGGPETEARTLLAESTRQRLQPEIGCHKRASRPKKRGPATDTPGPKNPNLGMGLVRSWIWLREGACKAEAASKFTWTRQGVALIKP